MSPLVESIKPLLVLVDDDPAVLEALEMELSPHFGEMCRIETFLDAGAALDAIREWQAERRPMALAIVDQRMPGLTGLELIRHWSEGAGSAATAGAAFHPAALARTVLLTGFGGPGLAAAAQAEPSVHRYREKPWRGDELDRDVRSLLADFWRAAQRSEDPIVQRVAAAGLERLWEQLASATPTAAPPRPEEHGTSPAEDELFRTLLADALRGGEGAWPSPEAVQAFLLGTPSPEQLSEVRAAVLASTSFRKEIAHLLSQFETLSQPESRRAFDEARLPEALRRLLEPGDDRRSS